MNPSHKEMSNPQTPPETKRPGPSGCAVWFAAIIFAVAAGYLLGSWLGGLLCLVVFWLMRLDPGRDSQINIPPTDAEKRAARRIYTWLFLSSLLTVPIMFSLLFGDMSDSPAASALVPLLIHIPFLFAGLTSKSRFVFRHTQQGILLLGLRAGCAVLAANAEDLGLFLLLNGSVWIFGTVWGRSQVSRGECWWMKQRGETRGSQEASVAASQMMREKNLSPQAHLDDSRSLMRHRQADSREHALVAFRLGGPEIKRQAVEILNELGEVETF